VCFNRCYTCNVLVIKYLPITFNCRVAYVISEEYLEHTCFENDIFLFIKRISTRDFFMVI
jgi:hypothetical protein